MHLCTVPGHGRWLHNTGVSTHCSPAGHPNRLQSKHISDNYRIRSLFPYRPFVMEHPVTGALSDECVEVARALGD